MEKAQHGLDFFDSLMTATGSHEYFYSLCGAQAPGEGYPQKNRHSYFSEECFFASPGNSALSYPKISVIPLKMYESPRSGAFLFWIPIV